MEWNEQQLFGLPLSVTLLLAHKTFCIAAEGLYFGANLAVSN